MNCQFCVEIDGIKEYNMIFVSQDPRHHSRAGGILLVGEIFVRI